MNQRAKALGLTQTTFYDPHGLPNSQDPKRINVSSAHDLAIMGMELMKYPLMREYAKTPSMPFSNNTFTATFSATATSSPSSACAADLSVGLRR